MKLVKKPWSRRKRALFRILLLILLAGLLFLTKDFAFTRDHVLREVEERLGCGPTEVIRELGELPIGDRGWEMFLAANDNTLILSGRAFHLGSGWQYYGSSVVDCSLGEPVAAGTCQMDVLENGLYREGDHKQTMVWFYGRVDDPEIQEVEVSLTKYLGGEPDIVEEIWETVIPRGEWLRAGGRYYFAVSWQTEGAYQGDELIQPAIRTRDSTGEWRETAFQTWTSTSLG